MVSQIETVTCRHQCTDKNKCEHKCCKGKQCQTVELTVLQRSGQQQTHKLSLDTDCSQDAIGELSEDSYWNEPDRLNYHSPAAEIRLSQPHHYDDFDYNCSEQQSSDDSEFSQ
jgi:hypothetical protein